MQNRDDKPASSHRASREKMWSSYHTLRTSEKYKSEWNAFLRQSGSEVSSIFCQYVGHFAFKKLVEANHVITSQEAAKAPFSLNFEETNAIRYAAGWVVSALKKKLLTSVHPQKSALQLCLWDLLDDGDEDEHESNQWMKAVDRGGLCTVNNITYELFVAMEKRLQELIHAGSIPSLLVCSIDSIVSDDDVQFLWSIIGAGWGQEIASSASCVLLEMLISQWIKIRGFSYASAWVEKYKSQEKRTLQKTKGLRKQLMPMQPKSKEN